MLDLGVGFLKGKIVTKTLFRWHPDEDDVYDGNVYQDTILSDLPCTAFRKGVGKTFTLNGHGHSLTLAPIAQGMDVFVQWCDTPGSGLGDPAKMTRIIINSGTLRMMSGEPNLTADSTLVLGPEEGGVAIDIAGSLIVQDMNVEGFVLPGVDGLKPGASIKILPGGTFQVGREKRTKETGFVGAFNLDLRDSGSMSAVAHIVELMKGAFVVGGGEPAGPAGASLEIVALPDTPTSGGGNNRYGTFSISDHRLACRSTSASLLKARSLAWVRTHAKVEDTASLSIACDAIAFDDAASQGSAGAIESSSIFAVGRGTASVTFIGENGGAAPFDFLHAVEKYPKGLFDFVTRDGANAGTFRFQGIGSIFEFTSMAKHGLITIDGVPDSGVKTTWKRETDSEDPSKYYFTVYLKK